MYQTLRNAIMRCDLRAGRTAGDRRSGERLGVSIIPVREALQMLQSEGLVVLVPHVGATVATISRGRLSTSSRCWKDWRPSARGSPPSVRRRKTSRSRSLVHEMDDVMERNRLKTGPTSTRASIWPSRDSRLAMLEEMTARVHCWDRVRRYYFRACSCALDRRSGSITRSSPPSRGRGSAGSAGGVTIRGR